MSKKSKVKSYARRTKKGISRVTGHDRNNKNKRNRNIAIGLGVGTSILALGLGAKHLAKKKGLKGKPNVAEQAVSFTPSPKPTVKPETPSATVAEVRQTTKAVVDKAKEIKADKPLNPSPSTEAPTNLREATRAAQQAKVTIVDESKTKPKKTNKFLDQALTGQGYQPKPEVDELTARVDRLRKWDANRGVVIRRKKQLEESLGKKVVDKTKGRLDFNPTPKSRKARKKAAKQLAAEAKRLRGLGEYY